VNFQKHFNAAHCKAKCKQCTTQTEGYHGATAALQTPEAIQTETLQVENAAATEALANMATAMTNDRTTTMGQLTQAITKLTAQLSACNGEISSLKSCL
jgi:hypothetical protein